MSAPVTYVLIAITCLISWQAWNQPKLMDRMILWPPAVDRYKQHDRLLGHGFLHADGMHLIFNMVTLYSFGPLMEQFYTAKISMFGYLLFYLSAIVIAILPTYLQHRHDASYRSLGASGAVSAILFAYILLDPWAGIYLFFIPIPIPAFIFAAIYVAYSIWMDRRGGDNINHSAHLWGAAYGVMVTLLLQPSLAGGFLQRILKSGA